MNKITFPLCKSGSLMLKNLPITLLPNVPACKNHNLHEEGFTKIFPCSRHITLNITAPRPINLQIIPYAPAEITFEKQV
jgi:hypothetical protein